MKDSAATRERISIKLAKIYGSKLASIIKKNRLKVSGPPMAWYSTKKAPFYFEAGIPIEKKLGKIPANVFTRDIAVDSVLVAHFYGNYNQLPQAYEALADILKSRKKTLQAKPYEIYVDDPMDKDGKLKDPYKVQTDIVFPWR
jgi:effector-binding domain-containing protein